MKKKGFSLIELLVSLAITGIVFLAIFHLSVLTGKQIQIYIERYNAYNQLSFALADMAARCPSASSILDGFDSAETSKGSFSFIGSSNIYNITPYEGDTEYTYEVDSRDLALEITNKTTGIRSRQVLVEAKFNPEIAFTRPVIDDIPMEPNFLIVTVSATCPKSASIGLDPRVVKAEGIKFSFVDVVKAK